MNDRAGLSSFLNGTVDELRNNRNIALVYLAIMIPLGALSGYFNPEDVGDSFGMGLVIDEALLSQGPLAVIVVFATFVVGLVAHYWLIAAMTWQTSSPSFDRFLPFVGITILSWIGIGLGLIVLLIPGIYLAVRWVAVLPLVLTRDDQAMDAFGDSNQLTRGYGWSIFGASLILFLAVGAFTIVVGVFSVSLAGIGAIVTALSAAVLESISSVIFAGFTVTVYRQLGTNQEEPADAFK
ncbi:MAG: glycerophosphoryl diester phosphodiesterase membrane domain-containing protein [Erythrobacter sp.]|uniref:glycerophosphoryl diester phosphodiesterase membrane domain-containing protein n=1 Tax=Erythrobacter sp. TaxID=1042 RepID=UPI003264455F